MTTKHSLYMLGAVGTLGAASWYLWKKQPELAERQMHNLQSFWHHRAKEAKAAVKEAAARGQRKAHHAMAEKAARA